MAGQKGKKSQGQGHGEGLLAKAPTTKPKPSREQGRLTFKNEVWYGQAWSKFSVSQNYKQEAQARFDLQSGPIEE